MFRRVAMFRPVWAEIIRTRYGEWREPSFRGSSSRSPSFAYTPSVAAPTTLDIDAVVRAFRSQVVKQDR